MASPVKHEIKTETDPSHTMRGMKAMLSTFKEIEEEQIVDAKRIVKLRFTSKQYAAFRDACKVFELVSADPGFVPLVKSALGADIKEQTIHKQLVDPIVEAPTKIPIKIPKLIEQGKKRESYFTNPTPLTKKGLQLYKKVASTVDKEKLRHDVDKKITCITDIRIMITKYIELHNLKAEIGTAIDNFLIGLAPETIRTNKDIMLRDKNVLYIPKGDRKIITGIVNEITFEPSP